MPLPSTSPALLARLAALAARGPTIRFNIYVLNAYVYCTTSCLLSPPKASLARHVRGGDNFPDTGGGLLAHQVTAKVCDSIPLYRKAKALARAGAPIARTTLCDLFHAVAAATSPLSARLRALVRRAPWSADETPQRVLDEGKPRGLRLDPE